jgi:hypothetical protein
MRNDARPIGSHKGHQSPFSERRSAEVVNRGNENSAPKEVRPQSHRDRAPGASDAAGAPSVPVLPANDATLNTKI